MAKYCTSLPSLLRIISVGQYQSKLYHRGKGSHSSVLGGIMTLFLTIIFVYYAATTLASVISRKHYSVDMTSTEYNAAKLLTLSDFESSLLNPYF